MLLGRMINNMVAVRNGLMDRNRKINLFGAHDLNVVALLTALGVYSPHVPKYSSAVIIELHRIGDCFYVKVCYFYLVKGISSSNGGLWVFSNVCLKCWVETVRLFSDSVSNRICLFCLFSIEDYTCNASDLIRFKFGKWDRFLRTTMFFKRHVPHR